MNLYETAVRKPVTTILVFVALVVLGVFSLVKLPIDLYPEFESNNIMVLTTYFGANSSDVETNVTKPLENVLNGVSNLKHISSKNREGISVISLEFMEGVDITEATNDVRDKLDAMGNRLPEDVGKPAIFRFGADDIPIVILSVEADKSVKALDKILEDNVVNELARIDGVGAVSKTGTVKREILIHCDPAKLEAYHVSIEQISRVILAENRAVSSGLLDIGHETTALRVQGEIRDPQEIRDLVVASVQGRNIYLRDLAEVIDGTAERQQESYANGRRSAVIVINKQSGANSVEISKEVSRRLPEISKKLPTDVHIGVIYDTSSNIVNTINSLKETIYITFFVVLLVVLCFLGRWRATFIIILTIPISLVGSFIYLYFSGNSLNIISLSSLSIAIGMVVDDAIVVLENITTHIERGAYPKQAAIHATNEVGISVVASTLTMLAVFLPLTLMPGMTGILFRQLGWIVSIIMIISTVAALSLTPTLSSQLLKRIPKKSRIQELVFAPIQRVLERFERIYERTLRVAVSRRRMVIGLSLAIFIFSLCLFPLVKTEFFPQQDISYITVQVELPVGTAVSQSRVLGEKIYKRWTSEIPELAMCQYAVGQADAENTFASMRSNGSHIIEYNVRLTDPGSRERSMVEVADYMRETLKDYPEIKLYRVHPGGDHGGGAGGQQAVDIEIYGHDFAKTDRLAQEIRERMKSFSSCSEIRMSREDYVPEFQIEFDRIKLAENGLNLSMASAFVRNSIQGSRAGFFREDGDEYNIRVLLAPTYRRSIKDIENLLIYTPQGKGIRLADLGRVVERYMPPTIERKDRQRIVTVKGLVAPGKALSDLSRESKKMLKELEIPEGVTYKVGGTLENQQESFADLTSLLVLIIMLVFIVMAAEFESLRDPFVIMFSIPFAFTGVILGLLITCTTLSVMSFIGLIMLMGIVVKNGIVLIDYIRLCRERGMSVRQSIIRAGRSRLRPVLMTTATTVLGMLPLAIGLGEGSEMWRPMGITVVFGLTVSTLITLVLVPTIYASLQKRTLKRERRILYRKLYEKQKSNLINSSNR
ncbi:cobalt-zinc-cadmium resistance protein CzcA; Cation efflux system protein CusA [Porphyromonas crevioricanis JCM 15906]|uniref:Cobalt-zinc-cadmium resistance protein CzcA Cation efflux system protein CusA n=1 Tax=Porphyromonas crevioricanis JCM 15906 TaxID=1305617 RepID=T1CS13_9PORP|nr:efflux RND transporter permease subunit [Porphyromonas crevioricanis]GAD05893.1 cobalt-zinc-cadmium resistance protein CzcA; Cation efflux system protein CusA [Porphyromonas crevioricanis JCM 15906]SKA03035.1 hydrophobic/amphiphilic exporter-1, HAE1 family [Porphyromonas crevioricanis]